MKADSLEMAPILSELLAHGLLTARSPIGQTTISKVGLQSQEHSHNDSGKASTSGVHNESHPRDQWGTGLIPTSGNWKNSNQAI